MHDRVIEILTEVGAILPNDHFVGTSGRHLEAYVNKDALFPHTKYSSEIGKFFAQAHADLSIDVVAAPALGGIILSQWTAHHLSEMKGKDILGVYAEKKDGNLVFTRGYDKLISGKNVLVIEDLTTTGGSLKKVIESVRSVGGTVTAASVMVNKDSAITSETFGVPFTALAQYSVTSYDASDCPLCEAGIPINTSVGHGKRL